MLKTSLPSDNSAMLEKAIAAVAAAMADPSRVKMLCALMDGRAWTATELSAAADVAPSTASGHLARLVEGAANYLPVAKGGIVIIVLPGTTWRRWWNR